MIIITKYNHGFAIQLIKEIKKIWNLNKILFPA